MAIQVAYVLRDEHLVPCHPMDVQVGDRFQLVTGVERSPMLKATQAPFRLDDEESPGSSIWVIPGEPTTDE